MAGAAPSHRPTGPFWIRLTCSPGSRRGPGRPQTTTCPAQGRTAGSGAGVLPAGPVVRVGWGGSGIAGARGRAHGEAWSLGPPDGHSAERPLQALWVSLDAQAPTALSSPPAGLAAAAL